MKNRTSCRSYESRSYPNCLKYCVTSCRMSRMHCPKSCRMNYATSRSTNYARRNLTMSCVIRHRWTNYGNCSNHRHRHHQSREMLRLVTVHSRSRLRRRRALCAKTISSLLSPSTKNGLKSIFRRSPRRYAYEVAVWRRNGAGRFEHDSRQCNDFCWLKACRNRGSNTIRFVRCALR
jgi:hypothetical protein